MSLELTDRFKHKIITANQFADMFGKPPRKNRVIMCHGVFDVVHPGHIRHLLYAKSKAPILIVSITADKHINKGDFRPHVPQELRALNLAAIELVDFVIIDSNETPIENLKLIKPDLFTKGYEYSPSKQTSDKTEEEISVITEYGGEVLFSPGDFIMSSSAYIKNSPPDIRIEKLLMLMSRAKVSFRDLEKTLSRFKEKVVHVVGDSIVDSYTKCSMIGGQTKTPTISVLFNKKIDYLGGAGIVALHMRAAGATVKFSTILGEDYLGEFTRNTLRDWQIEDLSILDRERPTTNKNTFIVEPYRLLKVDTLENRTISDSQVNLIKDAIASQKSDAIVFSDFRHGIFNRRTIQTFVSAIPIKTFKVADSQVASRWGNILDFSGFDLITPNEREVRFSLGDQDLGIRGIATELFRKSNCKMLILKLGDRGILTCTNEDASTLDSYFVMDSFVSKLIDPVGAGDALLAYSTLAMISTNNPIIASILGNLAASVECENDGNIPVTPDHILSKIKEITSKVNYGNN